jgi:hypothetical protein
MKAVVFLIVLVLTGGAVKALLLIHNLREAEAELRQENERLRTRVSHTDDLIGRVVFYQKRIEQIKVEQRLLKEQLAANNQDRQQIEQRLVAMARETSLRDTEDRRLPMQARTTRGPATNPTNTPLASGPFEGFRSFSPPQLQPSALDLQRAMQTSRAVLIERMRSKWRVASNSEKMLLEWLDSQLSAGTSVAQLVADPAERVAIQRSALAQELIAAYGGNASAFAQAETQEPARSYTPLSTIYLDHVRQLIQQGAKASEIISDPYTREAARHNPELRALVDEAARRNGE